MYQIGEMQPVQQLGLKQERARDGRRDFALKPRLRHVVNNTYKIRSHSHTQEIWSINDLLTYM